MNKEKQRIKIAETCGWKEIRAEVDWLPKELTGIFTWSHPTDAEKIKYFINRKPIPDYLNDLNAMHEAEKACLTTIPLVTDYGIRLVNALHREHKKNPRIQDTSWRIPVVGNCGWFATAAQRADAFCETLNLWEK